MLAQAYPLFVDVQFFKIENHLLLQSLAVQFEAELLRSLEYSLTDCSNAFRNQGLHLVVDGFNLVDTARHIPVEHLSLVGSVQVHSLKAAVKGCLH